MTLLLDQQSNSHNWSSIMWLESEIRKQRRVSSNLNCRNRKRKYARLVGRLVQICLKQICVHHERSAPEEPEGLTAHQCAERFSKATGYSFSWAKNFFYDRQDLSSIIGKLDHDKLLADPKCSLGFRLELHAYVRDCLSGPFLP